MTNYNPEFGKEFEKDPNVEEELDTFIKGLGSLIKEQEKGIFVTNPECLKRIEFVYRAVKYGIRGKKLKVLHELNKPFMGSGAVSVIGKDIRVTNPELFVKASKLADSFEVYPKVNGTVQLDFGFDGLVKKASE